MCQLNLPLLYLSTEVNDISFETRFLILLSLTLILCTLYSNDENEIHKREPGLLARWRPTDCSQVEVISH